MSLCTLLYSDVSPKKLKRICRKVSQDSTQEILYLCGVTVVEHVQWMGPVKSNSIFQVLHPSSVGAWKSLKLSEINFSEWKRILEGVKKMPIFIGTFVHDVSVALELIAKTESWRPERYPNFCTPLSEEASVQHSQQLEPDTSHRTREDSQAFCATVAITPPPPLVSISRILGRVI